MSLDQRRWAFEQWLAKIEQDHPDCEIRPTSFGCEVHKDKILILELDYDPHPPERDEFRSADY